MSFCVFLHIVAKIHYIVEGLYRLQFGSLHNKPVSGVSQLLSVIILMKNICLRLFVWPAGIFGTHQGKRESKKQGCA